MRTATICQEELKPAPIWADIAASITRRLPVGKSRLIEWLCRGSDRRFLGKMAAELGGHSFDCCLRDRLARDVFFAGCFAAQEIAFVRAVLRPGMTFVDVGANWGLFTLVAAHLVGKSGRIVALEPDPRILAKLRSNVDRNNLSQVEVFGFAVADREANLTLAAHDHGSDNWGISRLVAHNPTAQKTFTVTSRRLDLLLDEAGLQVADLTKIDVEGAEDMVLAGMDAGLKSYRYRRILLELHPQELAERHRTAHQVAHILLAKGYKGYVFDYSQETIRKAYYNPWLPFSEFVRPLDQLDRWLGNSSTRTVWLAPTEPDLALA